MKYNHYFHTIPELPLESQWQIKSGFVSKEIDKKYETGTENDKGAHVKLESTSITNQEQTPKCKVHWEITPIFPNKRDQGDPAKKAGQKHHETQQTNSYLRPQTKIDNKMKHMEMMQHKIETVISSHIQVEIICLEAMFPEHQEVEVDSIMA